MPIGKNAINRVKNNGYSNVESKAPDMENSVIANPDPQVVEKMVKPVEEKTAKKAPAKKPAAKKAPTKKEAAPVTKAPTKKPAAKKAPTKKEAAPVTEAPAKKPAAKKAPAKKTPANDGFKRVEVGGQMPYYLL